MSKAVPIVIGLSVLIIAILSKDRLHHFWCKMSCLRTGGQNSAEAARTAQAAQRDAEDWPKPASQSSPTLKIPEKCHDSIGAAAGSR